MIKLLLLICAITLSATGRVFAQTAPADFATARENYMKTNGVHTLLTQYAGEWDAEMTVWPTPKSQGEKFSIGATNTMLLNNRFLQTQLHGQLVGTAFESIITLGHSTANQRFTITQLDNMATGTVTLTGYFTSPMKIIELFGDMPTPENTDVVHIRQLITFIDRDNYLIQTFDKRAGQEEFKNLEYRFKRKKSN